MGHGQVEDNDVKEKGMLVRIYLQGFTILDSIKFKKVASNIECNIQNGLNRPVYPSSCLPM